NYRGIELPEAYLGLPWGARGSLAFGRKRVSWNRMDEIWELGVWQPRYRWDYLTPRSVGLTGFFAEIKPDNSWTLQLWASPLFVPERGTPLEFRDGMIRSPSPWFLNPPSELGVLGRPTPIRYSLEGPS